MIKVEFNIWTWKDYKKWFWDKFCFPRRKEISEWFDCYSRDMQTVAAECFIRSMGYDTVDDFIDRAEPDEHIFLENFEKDFMDSRRKVKDRFIELILKCK